MSNPFSNAQKQILKSYESANFWEKYKNELQLILEPKRVLEVNISIKMDNWEIKTFKAYRSQHNDARWVFKWWIRFHPNVNIDEVKALSIWMTIKCSVVDLPLGWGKWWIIVDPKDLSKNEIERLSRAYVWAIYKNIWPLVDVPAPDVNTNAEIMAYMTDEYSKLAWIYTPGSFTWKPLTVWGSKWREKATWKWWLFALLKMLELQNDSIKNKKIIVEWAGNVWGTFIELLKDLSIKLIWVSDSKWAIYNENWLEIDEIISLKKNKKSVIDYKNASILSNDELLEKECDILVPAALENRLTQENASNLKTKLILELANWPTTPEADEILEKRNIPVIPDILANAWWVMVSYFEQVQNNTNFYWEENEIEQKLKIKMEKATKDVFEISKELKVSYRKGAYAISLKRIFDAMKARNYN